MVFYTNMSLLAYLTGGKIMSEIKIHNKTNKPDNLVLNEHKLIEEIIDIERSLPMFLRDYEIYLKSAVSPSTRLAYLRDIRFFMDYLVTETLFTKAANIKDITERELSSVTAKEVNIFIGDYCSRYYREKNDSVIVYENHNRSLSRKKSSLASMFKFMYRNGQMEENITDGFNPIKLPKPQPDAIKRLHPEEIATLLTSVRTGKGLTDKELVYWEKTKLRDKLILLLFITYGLRLSELAELNVSSFNLTRNEFIIFRKRGKESAMPLNRTITNALHDYIENERIKTSDDALLLSLQGKRLTLRAIRQLVKKYSSIAMQTSREKGYSPHKLRATAASTLIEQGFSIYDVQNLLDHDNVTTTQLYSAHKKNAKRDIISKFELDEDQ